MAGRRRAPVTACAGLVAAFCERLNKKIRRRTDVVGIFPRPCQPAAPRGHAARRAGRRVVGRARRYFSAESMALIDAPQREEVLPALLMAG